MAHFELIPQRQSNGTIILRAVELRPAERLRRFLRRLLSA
jgi:hypothetical protein